MTATDTPTTVKIDGDRLSSALANCLVAASKDTSRPSIAAVKMTIADSVVWLESTDQYVLVGAVVQAEMDNNQSASVLIPRADVERFLKLKYRGQGVIQVDGDTLTMFGFSCTTMSADAYAYPATEKLWTQADDPSKLAGGVIGLSTSTLTTLSKIRPDGFQARNPAATVAKISFHGPNKMCEVRWTSDPTLRALVMVARINS